MGKREAVCRANSVGLFEKPLHIYCCQPHLHQLESDLRLEVEMLTEINIGKTAMSNWTDDALVVKLLTNPISHRPILSEEYAASTACLLKGATS